MHNSTDTSFLALDASTRHFTKGAPRSFVVDHVGDRVFFLRAKDGNSSVLHLWEVAFDGDGANERLILDVDDLDRADGEIPEAELQRRERMRESATGITAFDLDASGQCVVAAVDGVLYLARTAATPTFERLGDEVGVIDPRIDPTGQRVAYVVANELHVIECATRTVTVVAQVGEHQTVGLANFVAAEELDRYRGHWWSPDGQALAYEMADNRALETVWIFDPKDPRVAPTARQYPKAGGANPQLQVRFWHVDGTTVTGALDWERYPYLVTVSWPTSEGLLVTLMTRDHHDQVVGVVDATTGEFVEHYRAHDDVFLEWITGLPAVTPDGRLLVAAVDRTTDTYRVATVAHGVATPCTPVGLQVRSLVGLTDEAVLVTATPDATSECTARIDFAGTATVVGESEAIIRAVSGRPGGLLVTVMMELSTVDVAYVVSGGDHEPITIPSFAATPRDAVPPITPAVTMMRAQPHDVAVAVLWPQSGATNDPLPVILSPYGGPHFQQVVGTGRAYTLEQYLANQGYCVIVADGRGTGGRGPAWDRGIFGELGSQPVADQVAALDAVMAAFPGRLDGNRVGVRGWSFGGYLAARCVLERPDRFHAAIAGAPVTDFAWYDTGYTERYLGHPDTHATAYDNANLVRLAPGLERPLLLIHGYHDDNVLFAHTQLLSDALLAAGKPHQVIGLSGVTHMPVDPVAAQHMVELQLDFLHAALAPKH